MEVVRLKISIWILFVMDSKSGSFVSQSPDISSFRAFGVCIKQNGSSCSRELMSKAEFVRAFSISNGRKEIDSAMMPPFQEFSISTTTNLVKEEGNTLTLKVEQSLYGGLETARRHFGFQRLRS